MRIEGHKIERVIPAGIFIEIIEAYKEDNIICTEHTFFRLDERQRKLFKCAELKQFILHETPLLAGLQFNRKYAVFYKYKENTALRMILDILPARIMVVTFYIISMEQMPRL